MQPNVDVNQINSNFQVFSTLQCLPTQLILPHLENFTPNPKNFRITNNYYKCSFVGRKSPSPPPKKRNYPSSKNVLTQMICVNVYVLANLNLFLLDLNFKIFIPRMTFFKVDDRYIVKCFLLKYRLILLLVFPYLSRLNAHQIFRSLVKISTYISKENT